MGATFFEDLDSGATGQVGARIPFWAVNRDDDEDLLRWLNTELSYLQEQGYERQQNQRKNLAVFRGIQYTDQERKSRSEQADESTLKRKTKNPRIVYNHMVDMIEQDVARMTKYRGAVVAKPATEDDVDRITARVAEKLVEGFWDKVEIDEILRKHMRRRRIASEDFITCLWNPDLGPYHPDYIAKVFEVNSIKGNPREMTQAQIQRALLRCTVRPQIPLVDPETGNPITGLNGDALWMDRPLRLGDVEYGLVFSWNMFLQRQEDYSKVEYGMYRERISVDTLKADHPSVADEIKADGGDHPYMDLDTFEDAQRDGKCEVWHFYHKSTRYLDSGWYVKFTRNVVLKSRTNQNLGWDYQAILPWARTVDIDTPGVLNGDATTTHGRAPQAVYNNLVSLKLRNQFLFAHPKWFVQKGQVKLESLANQTTVVQHGGVPPVLLQPQLSESSGLEMQEQAKGDLQQIMGVYGVSRGDPPAGVTAAVALTFLDEQETERSNPGIAALTRTQKNLALMTLWLMADHYEKDDGRIAQMLGRNLAAMAKDFTTQDLRNISDLRIQNASALPQQKSARLQWILDIRKEFPGIIADDLAVDLLGLGEVERLQSQITVAIRKAESENEGLMSGQDVKAPYKFEYHLGHYRIHRMQMNEVAYADLGPELQADFEDHLMAHEMFMVDIAQTNPMFLERVITEFPDFPVLFQPAQPVLPVPPPTPGGAPQGAPAPEMVPPPPPGVEGLPAGAETAIPMEQGVPMGVDATTLGG